MSVDCAATAEGGCEVRCWDVELQKRFWYVWGLENLGEKGALARLWKSPDGLWGTHGHWPILRKPQLGVGGKEANTGVEQCGCNRDGQGPRWGFVTPTELRPLFAKLWLLSLPLRPMRGHQILTALEPCFLLSCPPQSLGQALLLT